MQLAWRWPLCLVAYLAVARGASAGGLAGAVMLSGMQPGELAGLADQVVVGDLVAAYKHWNDRSEPGALLYMSTRIYGRDNVRRWRELLEAHIWGFTSAFKTLSLTYRLSYLIWQNSTGPADSALPALSDTLTEFTAFDLFYTIGLPEGQHLRAPLGVALLSIIGNYVKQSLAKADLNRNGELAVLQSFEMAKGFDNAQAILFTQRIFLNITITGEGVLPFRKETETLVLIALRNCFYGVGSPMVSHNITAFTTDIPRRRRRSDRRLHSSPPAVQVTLSSCVIPVDQGTPTQLASKALGSDQFLRASTKLGIALTAEVTGSRIVTNEITKDGVISSRTSRDSISGYAVPLASVSVTTQSNLAAGTPSVQAAGATTSSSAAGGSSVVLAASTLLCISAAVAALSTVAWFVTSRKAASPHRGGKDSFDSFSKGGSLWKKAEAKAAGVARSPAVKQPCGPKLGSARMFSLLRAHSAPLEEAQALLAGVEPPRPCKPPRPPAASMFADMAGAEPAAGIQGGVDGKHNHSSSLGGDIELPERKPSAVSSRLQALSSADLCGTAPEIAASEVQICHNADGSRVVLGKGSFGQVYKAKLRGMQDVAVKVACAHDLADGSWVTRLRKEVAMLQKVSFDRNIVQYYGTCLPPGDDSDASAMIVMEYMAGGDLQQALSNDVAGELDWHRRGRDIALDVSRGLTFLHATGVVHRDLKSSNVLLSGGGGGTAKIGDMGLGKLLESDETSLQVAGTFAYAAPELLLGLRVTDKADIYSMGVLLWEMCARETPSRGRRRELRTPQECPPGLQALINECLATEPADRPSAKEVYQRIAALPYLGVKPKKRSRHGPRASGTSGVALHTIHGTSAAAATATQAPASETAAAARYRADGNAQGGSQAAGAGSPLLSWLPRL